MKLLEKLKKVPKTATGLLLVFAGYAVKAKVQPIGEALIYVGTFLAGLGGAHKAMKKVKGMDPFEGEKEIARAVGLK